MKKILNPLLKGTSHLADNIEDAKPIIGTNTHSDACKCLFSYISIGSLYSLEI